MTGGDIMPSVWGIIPRQGSPIKVSIELSAATRHHHDMTERFLKMKLNLSNT